MPINGWFYSLIIVLFIFFLLVDWKTLGVNIWGGLFALLLEIWQDSFADFVGMYHLQNEGIKLFGTSAFFTFEVLFTGILFMQHIPDNPKLQLAHILVFSIGFLFYEFIMTKYGYVIHNHWNYAGSFFINVIIMGSIVWLKYFVIRIFKSGAI